MSRAPGEDAAAPQAWLVAVKDSGALTEFDRLVVHQAVTVVALELLRRRVADDTVRRLAGDVLTAVLSGELAGPELARRLEPFGLRGRVGTIVLQPVRQVRAAVAQELERALRDEAGGGLVADSGTFTVALLPGADDDELFAVAERVRARVQAHVGQPLPAAAGRAGDVRRSFHEARCAFEARVLAEPQSHAQPPTAPTGRRLPMRRRPGSPPTAISARSSCCCRCRTTRRWRCSATRCWRRSSARRAPTAAS